jgi:hypothetical protein
MIQKQLDALISNIDSKHQRIGIGDRGLATRLGELYSDIYCDANQGSKTFGMYKGLLNYSQKNTSEEYEYFINGPNSLFNQQLIHSVFVNTLCCVRRITDTDNDTQSITRLHTKVEREVKNRIPNNEEVKEWFKELQYQHKKIIAEMDPLLTYIDKRICHYDRNWERKRKLQKIEEIENVYNLINKYENMFRGFYEQNSSQTTMILTGEEDAARFIRIYYESEHLDNVRKIISDLAKNPEIPKDVIFTLLQF